MISALFVQTRGAYFNLPDVDPWDEARDARKYRGPHPVVAHPPCSRWCRLAGLVEARWGYKRGEDGGCFASALASVRAYGGVLEHPAFTDAWATYGLQAPDRFGGWTRLDAHGGSSAHVEQHAYGHRARKATWIYVVGAPLPELRWGSGATGSAIVSWLGYTRQPRQAVSWCGNAPGKGHSGATRDDRPRLEAKERSATPAAFKEVLLAIAHSVTMSPRPRVLPRRIVSVPRTLETMMLDAQRAAYRAKAHERLTSR